MHKVELGKTKRHCTVTVKNSELAKAGSRLDHKKNVGYRQQIKESENPWIDPSQ